MMRLPDRLMQRAADYSHYRFAPRVVILLYHRVIDLASDPQLLSVASRHFDEHLEILRRYTQPMNLRELTATLQEDRLPRRGVAITFDDGYVDNLQNAKPLLERHEIPATFFIIAGQPGRREEFWWDELERLLLLPGKLPAALSLSINGSNHRWEIGASTEYSADDYQRYRSWHIEQPDDPSPRHKLYRSLYQLIHPMHEMERRGIIERLQAWAGKDSTARPSHRALTVDEVALLEQEGLIEVGAHTMTHPPLAGLPLAVQREEIMRGKACLEEILDRPVISFAYPHGSYSDETISLVREAGFSCACSSDANVVWRGANGFKLPRVAVRDWDGDEFARWLKGWVGI